MSQRRSARVKSQTEKAPIEAEPEPEPTIAPTLLYSLNPSEAPADGSPTKATPTLRRQGTATPFHEPHLYFTPSQNTLATLGAPMLPPLLTPGVEINTPILALNSNQNERLLDEDPNETQLLTPRASKSKSSISARGEILSPLDNVSSPEDETGKSPKKTSTKVFKGAESISEEGEKERLIPLSNENWRENLDSSQDLTSPTLSKKKKEKKASPWKEREESEEILSPKPKEADSDEGFDLNIPSPLHKEASKSKEPLKPKDSPKGALKTLKVVEVKRATSPAPSPFKSPPKPTPTPSSKNIIKKRKRTQDNDEKEVDGPRLTRRGSQAEIISISSLEDNRGAASAKKKAITDYLDLNAPKSPFESNKKSPKQIVSKNAKAQELDSEEDNFDADAAPISLPKTRGGQKRSSRKSDSVGHSSATKKRKRDESSEVEESFDEPRSERRTSKRARPIVLSEESFQEDPMEEVFDDEVSTLRTNLFKKERKPQKETDLIDAESLLEVDFPRFLQEEDKWFLFEDEEAQCLTAVSSSQPRLRLFNGCTFILTGLSQRPDTPAEIPSLIDSLTRIAKAFGAKIGEAPPTKLFSEEVIPEESGNESEVEASEAAFTRPNCFLLAPTHLRTAKYLQALALGVPCVHYSWLLFCYIYNRYFDPIHFLLKAGVSASCKVVSQSPRLLTDFPKNEPSFLFFNENVGDSYRVEVAGDGAFKKSVEGIARAAGAKIVSRLLGPYQKESHIDFVISDPTPSKLICASASKKALPLLSREWLIQCLVRNSLLSEDEDEAFVIPNPLLKKKR